MDKLREKFLEVAFKKITSEECSKQCEQITDDFTVAFAIFLRQKCLIDDNYLYYFFNGKKYNEAELLQHFKNNIYDN
jgi:predicted RNase H-like nuclease